MRLEDALRGLFRWRWILPLGQLLVCALLLAPWWRGLLSEAHGSILAYSDKQGASPPRQQRHFALKMDYSEEEQRQMRNFERRIWAPAALNFPAGALEIPYDMFSRTHEEWHPSGMYFLYWRALTWPLAGIAFWWSAGKSLEGLLLARRSGSLPLSWIHPILGIWEMLTGGALYVLGVAFAGKTSPDPPPDVVAGGGMVWLLLGATTIAGFWLQRRIAKKAADQGQLSGPCPRRRRHPERHSAW